MQIDGFIIVIIVGGIFFLIGAVDLDLYLSKKGDK